MFETQPTRRLTWLLWLMLVVVILLVVAVVWEVLLEDSVLTEVLGGSDPLLLAPERLSLR